MIRFTAHAEDMIDVRRIERRWVIATLSQPTFSVADPHDMTLTRSFRSIPEAGGRILRVVHRPSGDDIVVVTAHFDRGASS